MLKKGKQHLGLLIFHSLNHQENNKKLIIKLVELLSPRNPDLSKVLYSFGVTGKKVDEKQRS